MKHLWIVGLMLFGGMLLAGTDIDVNGKFAGSKVGDKAPKGWYFNVSIKPDGTGKVVQVGDEFGVQITNPKRAVAYYTKQFKVTPGEQYEMSCDAVGTGKAYLAMYFYKQKGWCGSILQPAVTLQPGKNELKYTFTVPADIKGAVPVYGSFAFYVQGPGEVTFTDVEVEKEDVK